MFQRSRLLNCILWNQYLVSVKCKLGILKKSRIIVEQLFVMEYYSVDMNEHYTVTVSLWSFKLFKMDRLSSALQNMLHFMTKLEGKIIYIR